MSQSEQQTAKTNTAELTVEVNDTSSATSSSSYYQVPEGYRVSENRDAATKSWYRLPTDDEEVGRLDFQHYVIRYLVHGNFSSPVEDLLLEGIQVLDAGTGSGRWVLEMAADYPESTYIGTDKVSIFPTEEIPANCEFMLANTLNLPFADETFGFVYQRNLMMSHTPADWKNAMIEMARVTKPGGWIECFEIDLDMTNPPSDYTRLRNAVGLATQIKGIDISVVKKLGSFLESCGLVEVEQDYVSCPFAWGGRVGTLCVRNLELGYLALRASLAPVMGMTDEEYEEMIYGLAAQFRTNRSWIKVHYAFGMKPFN
ncbi:S-adenosyl-L-methionine-dependent methyltransferase [Endogone sp. FLAS-F59071]|nr:S-adenosyl-L-methionine-dependent methyltransferase [Endogone sp. FLAS-F59071]|eukprot:RUS15054.1 S-adenosyl-L-methionine-dependent methyltransferase [Endogone sp. FLAS-F59071]